VITDEAVCGATTLDLLTTEDGTIS